MTRGSLYPIGVAERSHEKQVLAKLLSASSDLPREQPFLNCLFRHRDPTMDKIVAYTPTRSRTQALWFTREVRIISAGSCWMLCRGRSVGAVSQLADAPTWGDQFYGKNTNPAQYAGLNAVHSCANSGVSHFVPLQLSVNGTLTPLIVLPCFPPHPNPLLKERERSY